MTISAAGMLNVQTVDSYGQKTPNAKAKGKSLDTIPFAQMMNQSAAKNQDPMVTGKAAPWDSKLNSVDQTQTSQKKQAYDQLSDSQNHSTKETESVLPEENVDAAVKAVNDISEGIKEKITEETGISEEDLDQVMETLGLSYMDLLNPKVLQQVLTSLEEITGETGFLLDMEGLAEQLIPQIEEVTTEALSNNGISLEDFQEFLQEADAGELELPEDIVKLLPTQELSEDNTIGLYAKHLQNETDSVPVGVSVQSQEQSQAQVQPQAQGQTAVMKSIEVIHISDEEMLMNESSVTVTEVSVTEKLSGQEEMLAINPDASQLDGDIVTEVILPTEEVSLPDEQMNTMQGSKGLSENSDFEAFFSKNNAEDANQGFSEQGENSGQTNMGRMDTFQEMQPNQPQTIASVENTFAQTLRETTAPLESYTSAQTTDIINQIVSSASTTISETVSRMEMELNPQNLGRMIMQVQQEGDVVTAKLIAQNENVKNALETQMMQLRQSLEEKGIKVNAVEISVGTHEFERNLEEGMSQQFNEANGERQQNSARGRTRNLNRDELDGLGEELTEEEALAATIMRDNGGTVDYSA